MKEHGGIFEFYEIIPGFITSMILTIIVSLFTNPPEEKTVNNFDEMVKILKN